VPLPASERELIRLVDRLSGAARPDIEAVLAQLDEIKRARVEALLAKRVRWLRAKALTGVVNAQAPASTAEVSATQGLSVWLATRIDPVAAAQAASSRTLFGGRVAAPVQAFAMTERARKALKVCAERQSADRPQTTVAQALQDGGPMGRAQALFGGLRARLGFGKEGWG
jgi:hypothetical protein